MGCSGLLMLGLVLKVAHCLEIPGPSGEPIIEITDTITAALGEEVYLGCRYLGESEILWAEWKRQTKTTSKRLAGFNIKGPFGRDGFSVPDSITNLSVRVNVSSVDMEGEYTCVFNSEDDESFGKAFITVVAQPDIQILVNAETINGTHYQSVSCSAIGGRPLPQISWLVNGLPPTDYPFTANLSETAHSNGTSTLSSILRFPTHTQDEDSVTCVVQHPTLPNPKLTAARVETYTRPNVTVKAEMVQRGGSDFWVVSCISSGGRPDTDISLALNGGEELQTENNTDSDRQIISVHLPAVEYEGRNLTCTFGHPKFTHTVLRVKTLPTFYLSGVQLSNSELQSNSHNEIQDIESLELQDGQSDTVIGLQVTGNVPRYNVTCKKDDGPLPEDVELVGSSLIVQGPVGHRHAGLYECFFSYYHHQATLKFNVTVKPHVIQLVPPTVRVDLQTRGGRRVIECSAADAVPAANMSWLLPKGVSEGSWFNFTSHNGSHSVTGVLLLPACSPWELTAECVINHPAFEEPENRSITLPLCARPNISISSHAEFKDGEKYEKVDCSVDSVAPAATIKWHLGNGDKSPSSLSYTSEVQPDGLVSARSSVHFLSSLYSGQNLTCMVEHPSLEAPENRTIHIPVHKAPLLNVSLQRPQDSNFWLAVCDCRGEGAGTNLAWILPENAKSQTPLQSEYEGQVLKARLTYQFPLALHEGQDLTCVYHCEHGITEKTTIHVPKYYISSVRVLNHTTPLKNRHGGELIAHRMTLQENRRNQRVLLRIEGNVPDYDLDCQRSDGTFVQMERDAMVFWAELTEKDEGQYTCQASFYHHIARVIIQVEIQSEDKLFAKASMIYISSASAILLILVTALWVCCKVNSKMQYKASLIQYGSNKDISKQWAKVVHRKESLAALTNLMQQPGSPEVKKPPVMGADNKEYAHLVSYSIVIDVKSTV